MAQVLSHWADAGTPIQTKLQVGEPGDAYEQEADRVASRVLAGEAAGSISSYSAPAVQKKEGEGEEAPAIELHLKSEGASLSLASASANADALGQLGAARGGGSGLPAAERGFFESAFCQDFSGVRVHFDATAEQMSGELGARAFTQGQDIFFGAGQYQPGSLQGRSLLAHELTHVVQQAQGSGSQVVQRQVKDKKDNKSSFSIRVPVSGSMSHDEFHILALRKAFGLNQQQAEECLSEWTLTPVDFVPGPDHIRQGYVTVLFNPESYFNLQDRLKGGNGGGGVERDAKGRRKGAGKRQNRFNQLPIKERVALNAEANRIFWERTGYNEGEQLGSSPEDQAQARLWQDIQDELLEKREKIQGLPKDILAILGGEKGIKPGDYDQALRIVEKLKKLDDKARAMHKLHGLTENLDALENSINTSVDTHGGVSEKPEELQRLFQVLKDKVQDPQFAKGGRSWISFAKFLDKNKDKIEGILYGNPPGHLTQEKIDKIIVEYGKFISAEPVEEPSKIETQEEFDKHFQYDPGWQKLSKEDRKLLIEYAKLNPEDIEEGKVDFERVTTDMKLSMALKLSWQSWPGEVAEAAKNAFSDPTFIITLLLIVGVYVGLWLTPEPTAVTKLAAGLLTAVLLIEFAWDDLYGLAVAWMALRSQCAGAKTVAELQAAGDVFAKKVGQVGFDILLAVAMWGLGKAVKPKISKLGASRNVARAEAKLAQAEAQPGSGRPVAAEGDAVHLMDKAVEKAKGSGTSEPGDGTVLDALNEMLGENAQKGLAKLREAKGDAQVRRMLDGRLRGGQDLTHFLEGEALDPQALDKARKGVQTAQVKLARAKLIELRINEDPLLRNRLKVDTDDVARQLKDKNIRADDEAGFKEVLDGYNVDELISQLGEAIARANLKSDPGNIGKQVIGSLECVQEVPGYKSINEWKLALKEKLAGEGQTPEQITSAIYAELGKWREGHGKLWESRGEIDNLVAELGPDGKLSIVELEEVKTGRNDTHSGAMKQLDKVLQALDELASGRNDIRLFDKVGKTGLGSDRTGDFNLSDRSSIKKTTIGPLPEKPTTVKPNEGFMKNLPYTRTTLTDLARLLVEDGLPLVWTPQPSSSLPPTGSHDQKK